MSSLVELPCSAGYLMTFSRIFLYSGLGKFPLGSILASFGYSRFVYSGFPMHFLRNVTVAPVEWKYTCNSAAH